MEMSLLEMQKNLRNMGILISFSGRFSQGVIVELGDAIKKYMETEDTSKNNVFNIFSIFIEQTQNIKNYAASKEGRRSCDAIANSGIVSIGKSECGYVIWSGNLMENADVQALTEKLENLSKLDKTELKGLYKEQMRKEIKPDSEGAGLGLIDIARKASSPIEYSIKKMDDSYSFYELKVIV